MGTMAAWGGSSGKWTEVRDISEKVLRKKKPKVPQELLDALGDALERMDDSNQINESPLTSPLPPVLSNPLPGGPTWLRVRGGGGSGGGGGGGASVGGGGRTGGRHRSQAYAAGVGGNVLAAALAYRGGDAKTLASLGLDLQELQSLSALRRVNTILNALVGADGGIEDAELRRVNARVLRDVFKNDLNGVAAIRLYIIEYTVQVWASETGKMQRVNANRPQASRELERQLRGALKAKAKQVEIAAVSTAAAFRQAISDSLKLMRQLMRGL